MSIVLSLAENKLNKYTFNYSIDKFWMDKKPRVIWIEYTDSNGKTKEEQIPGRPLFYPSRGSVTISLPSHQTLSVRLKVSLSLTGGTQYSAPLTITTNSGKIDPPLNVRVLPQNASRSLEDWEVLLTWDNSKNIGTAPISKLKIQYQYSYTGIFYSKLVDISEWDSPNSYTWTFSSPYKNQSTGCSFSLSLVNEAGEESELAYAPHDLGFGRTNTLFNVGTTWKPDVTVPASPLFNEISWTNNPSVDSFIKTYLNIASDRWSKYIGISPTIAEKIKSIDPKFYNGIYLNKYTTINDSSKPIMECTPARYVGIKLNDGRWNFITVSFNLVFNKYYENNSSRASSWDLINSATHHLGHALGIGAYWHLNQIYENFPDLKSQTIEYPRYRLDGNLFPQTKLIHNAIHKAAPEDFYGWELRNNLIPNPVLRPLSRPPVQNTSAIPCKRLGELNLPCASTTPEARLTGTSFYSYGSTYTKYEVSNVYEPPLSRRFYEQDRRFIPLDQIGSLTTDNIQWIEVADSSELNGGVSPTPPLQLWRGDKNQPFVSGLSADIEDENFPGCHFGLIDNPLTRRLFTYNHRALQDIMLYRTITSDSEGISWLAPQRISYLSIAHLKDLGYTELYENQRPGPTNLRAEELNDYEEGFATSKLNNHNCCRGFSPAQIESWQLSGTDTIEALSEDNSEMLKIADIIDGTMYCYIDQESC